MSLEPRAARVARVTALALDLDAVRSFVARHQHLDQLVRRYESTFAAAFPARTDDVLAALRSPDASWPGPALVWASIERGHAELLERPPRGITLGR